MIYDFDLRSHGIPYDLLIYEYLFKIYSYLVISTKKILERSFHQGVEVKIPKKVAFLLRRVLQDKLPIKENLWKKEIVEEDSDMTTVQSDSYIEVFPTLAVTNYDLFCIKKYTIIIK